MINNTYFKVLREEKKLLAINLITLLLSASLSIISVYIIKDIYCVIITMILSVAFRSIIGERILYKTLNIKGNLKATIAELIYSIMFIIVSIRFRSVIAFSITLLLFIIYMIICKTYTIYFDSLKMVIQKIKKK